MSHTVDLCREVGDLRSQRHPCFGKNHIWYIFHTSNQYLHFTYAHANSTNTNSCQFIPIQVNKTFKNKHSNGIKTHDRKHTHFQIIYQLILLNYFTFQPLTYQTYASSRSSHLIASNMTKTKHQIGHMPSLTYKFNHSNNYHITIHSKMTIYITRCPYMHVIIFGLKMNIILPS